MTSLENQSGKLAKEQILKNNKGDMDFREALIFLLNPYIVTGISTKKMNKDVSGISEKYHPIRSLDDIIEHLSVSNTGRDEDIALIQRYIEGLESEELQTFVKKFVTKDLKLGISEKTVNKVYGKGTIPSFAVMLAESFAKKSDKVTGKFYVTLKLDGNRCVAIVDNSVVKFFSRKGQPVEGMVELEEQFANLPNGVYDGELLLFNINNLPSDELFRATQKVVRKDGDKKGLKFHIFDYLSISEFQNGKSEKTYEERRYNLDTMISKFIQSTKNISILPVLYVGTDKSVIPTLLEQVEKDGYEGLMVNTANGYYENKRIVGLQKVKTMQTADLLVLDIEEAIDGQFKGLLGRVNVEYKGNSVGVGSGFTLEQRRQFIANPSEIVGKIIEVQFFEESKDEKTELPSLRFPVFKSIRTDKGIEDINYE